MKILVALLIGVMLFVSSMLTAQKQTITITMEGISSDKGTVKFALYDETNFRLQPLQSATGKIIDGKTTIVFEDVAPGTYAIVCFHDKNDNNKMDFQPNGMPLENFGASNNSMSYGPPEYEDAKFVVANKNVTLEIRF
jgi:uncharacterized protein (DUF2141 family)|tara:strand:- start:9630 stop:10043 length:414 start_codon:yes stop_codon:yes gene_type:complete